MRVDFHCHVKLFTAGSFRPGQLLRRLNWARHLGLEVLAVTEHLDLPDYRVIYACLEERCHTPAGGYVWRGMTVLPGAEVGIAEGGDILLVGSPGSLRELQLRLGRVHSSAFPPLPGTAGCQ